MAWSTVTFLAPEGGHDRKSLRATLFFLTFIVFRGVSLRANSLFRERLITFTQLHKEAAPTGPCSRALSADNTSGASGPLHFHYPHQSCWSGDLNQRPSGHKLDSLTCRPPLYETNIKLWLLLAPCHIKYALTVWIQVCPNIPKSLNMTFESVAFRVIIFSVYPCGAVETICAYYASSWNKHRLFAHVNNSVCFANPTRGRLLSQCVTICRCTSPGLMRRKEGWLAWYHLLTCMWLRHKPLHLEGLLNNFSRLQLYRPIRSLLVSVAVSNITNIDANIYIYLVKVRYKKMS